MLPGGPVSTCTSGLYFILQGNSPLLLTPWVQRLFPETFSSREDVSCVVLRHAPSTREAGRLPPGCPDTEHNPQNAHWGTNKSVGPSAVLPAWHSQGRGLTSLQGACAALHRTLLLSSETLAAPCTDGISLGIHAATLISLTCLSFRPANDSLLGAEMESGEVERTVKKVAMKEIFGMAISFHTCLLRW